MAQSSFETRARALRLRLRRHRLLRPLVDRVGMVVWRRRLRRRAGTAERTATNRLTVTIDPGAVDLAFWRHDLLAAFGLDEQHELVGLVRDGDWDLGSFPLAELTFFDAVRLHYADGVDWMDTPFYREVDEAVRSGRRLFKYATPEDLPAQWARLDELYASMREHGFRSQAELGTNRPWDEIVVAFDRVGRTHFVNGRHRLAVARVLDLPAVTAVVGVRHRDWVRFTTDLRTAVAEGGGISYQPLPHPDLADVPARKQDERFDLIAAALPVRHGRLLDIGANKGWFCHRFEQAGFDCVAVERSVREAWFLEGLRAACERRFTVVQGDVAEVLDDRPFDVVLALNVFHHLCKTREGYESLLGLLPRLRTRYLVFEPHRPDEAQMRGAYTNPAPEAFVALLLAHSDLRRSEQIGTATDGRPLYLLST